MSEDDKERGMEMNGIPFSVTDWAAEPTTMHPGTSGMAQWRTRHFDAIRVRMVEYSPGYLADHWCVKGHILFVVAGELVTKLEDGRVFTLTAGMSYQVADHAEAHQSHTETGATLFIVD